MEKKLEQLLDDFSKKELAFFAHYKLKSYQAETQKEITDYLLGRGVNAASIPRIVKESSFSAKKVVKGNCERCNSDKFYHRQKEVYENRGSNMLESETFRTDILKEKVKVCLVCDYDFELGRKRNFLAYWYRKLFGPFS